MNNQDGQILTRGVAQELIQELFAGQTIQRREIIKTVTEKHSERGGQLTNIRSDSPIIRALSKMKEDGLAKTPARGLWYILLKIKTLDEFIGWARKFERGGCVFRGVSNAKYGIQASAYRRPEKGKRNFEKFLQINRDLIRNARLRGYDQKDGRELKELEILADLQHFGAATCLIDFTHSAQVALWFACRSADKEPEDTSDAKVFTVQNQPRNGFKEIVPTLLKENIDHFLQGGQEPQLYHWQPRQQNHRIIAQQSIFLFGHYEFDANDECVIAKGSQQNILDELQKISGITEDRLFPDLEGFAHVNRQEAPYTELTASDYVERGLLAADGRSEYEDAIADYDIAIDMDPREATTYYLRGFAKSQLKRYEKALEDYNQSINLQRDYADAYRDRGFAKFHMQLYEEALEDFDEAVDLDPNDARAFSGRGRTCYHLEFYEDALEDFDEAVDLDPNEADTYRYRGIVKAQFRQVEAALEDFDRAIHLNPNNVNAYYNRGIMKRRSSQHESAILDFDKTISLDPERADAYYHRGQSKFRLSLLNSAKEDLQKALPLAINTGDEELVENINNTLSEVNFRISRGSQNE